MTSPHVAKLRSEAEKCRKERSAIAAENVRLRHVLNDIAGSVSDSTISAWMKARAAEALKEKP